MPQSLNDYFPCPHALDDWVWAGIKRKLITVRNALDAAFCRFKGMWPGLYSPDLKNKLDPYQTIMMHPDFIRLIINQLAKLQLIILI